LITFVGDCSEEERCDVIGDPFARPLSEIAENGDAQLIVWESENRGIESQLAPLMAGYSVAVVHIEFIPEPVFGRLAGR